MQTLLIIMFTLDTPLLLTNVIISITNATNAYHIAMCVKNVCHVLR